MRFLVMIDIEGVTGEKAVLLGMALMNYVLIIK